jgi:hypothetical protein
MGNGAWRYQSFKDVCKVWRNCVWVKAVAKENKM